MNTEDKFNATKEDIARNVFLARKVCGYNHIELVEICGITRPILSGIENSSANPTLNSLIKLCSSLNLSLDMLIISRPKFEKCMQLLKNPFEKERLDEFDLLISQRSWKLLMKFSGDESKKHSGKVAKICSEIILHNFTDLESKYFANMTLGATLGVIFQKDGFKYGLEFGAWLGRKLTS